MNALLYTMGTRSLICIFYKGRFYLAQYTQFDGYPGGQGVDIFRFLIKPDSIEHLKRGLEYVKEMKGEEVEEIHSRCFAEDIKAQDEDGVFVMVGSSSLLKNYPSLSRECGAKIFELIANANPDSLIPIFLDLGFANSALFCEWAYCVDLDNEKFEVYGGAQPKARCPTKRFNEVGGPNEPVPALVHSFSLKDLPATEDEFYRALS